MISPTVNFSYTPDQGWTWIETYVSGRVFTDNGSYLVNGAQTLSQRPLLRLEAWKNADVQGALAARNMLGAGEVYREIPWFWSDQYELTLQIAGHPSSAALDNYDGALPSGYTRGPGGKWIDLSL